jgi:hypothetical protein
MLAKLRAKHLVIGHQPGKVHFADGTVREKDEPFAWAGRVFLIDTGLSRGVSDSGGVVLEITRAEAKAVRANGVSRTLWTSR